MALWKDQYKPAPAATPEPVTPARFDLPVEPTPEAAPAPVAARTPSPATAQKAKTESLIAPDIAIEGKIEGSGHVRIAGRFKGDIDVRGDLTIEHGAHVTGSVRADKVTISGELVGNIEAASHVDLMQSGALTGDLKAATLTVAAGSRMRGQADFGWEDSGKAGGGKKNGNGNGSDHGKNS
jgi:cytoskeletal protein CcmA (bactofilin family)